jgi:hypothetical protein
VGGQSIEEVNGANGSPRQGRTIFIGSFGASSFLIQRTSGLAVSKSGVGLRRAGRPGMSPEPGTRRRRRRPPVEEVVSLTLTAQTISSVSERDR